MQLAKTQKFVDTTILITIYILHNMI